MYKTYTVTAVSIPHKFNLCIKLTFKTLSNNIKLTGGGGSRVWNRQGQVRTGENSQEQTRIVKNMNKNRQEHVRTGRGRQEQARIGKNRLG